MKHNRIYSLIAGMLIIAAAGIFVSCENGMTGNEKPNISQINLGNINFDAKTFEKTSLKEIVKKGTTAEIFINDDSSWNTYYNDVNVSPEEKKSLLKGVFLNGRKVRLSPFALSQYEVTQELYEAVMGHNPSNFKTGSDQKLRPVENVNWYDAVVFCNKLSLRLKLTPYYSIEGKTINWEDIQYDEIPDTTEIDWDKVVFNKNSNGFRLPTEAEWEFAARGGDTQNEAWCFAFSGAQCATLDPPHFYPGRETDANLNEYGWYSGNSGNKTYAVGRKKANRLGLYDMSGNVHEWCFDWSAALQIDGTIEQDPYGPARPGISAPARITRGGSFYEKAYDCAVSRLNWYYPHRRANYIGIRLARSLTEP